METLGDLSDSGNHSNYCSLKTLNSCCGEIKRLLVCHTKYISVVTINYENFDSRTIFLEREDTMDVHVGIESCQQLFFLISK